MLSARCAPGEELFFLNDPVRRFLCRSHIFLRNGDGRRPVYGGPPQISTSIGAMLFSSRSAFMATMALGWAPAARPGWTGMVAR